MINLPADISLHWIDLSAGLLIFLSVLFGFFRGFTHELLALITWLAAAVITHYTYDFNAAWISENISNNNLVVTALAVAVIFVALVILFSILASPLWRAVRRSDLWLIDRGLGLFVGLARGVVLVLILWVGVAWGTKADTKREWGRSGAFIADIDDNSRKLLFWVKALPHDMIQRDWIQEGIVEVEQNMGEPLTRAAAADQNLTFPLQPTATNSGSIGGTGN